MNIVLFLFFSQGPDTIDIAMVKPLRSALIGLPSARSLKRQPPQAPDHPLFTGPGLPYAGRQALRGTP
jgi:hypothetical protein